MPRYSFPTGEEAATAAVAVALFGCCTTYSREPAEHELVEDAADRDVTEAAMNASLDREFSLEQALALAGRTPAELCALDASAVFRDADLRRRAKTDKALARPARLAAAACRRIRSLVRASRRARNPATALSRPRTPRATTSTPRSRAKRTRASEKPGGSGDPPAPGPELRLGTFLPTATEIDDWIDTLAKALLTEFEKGK